MSHSPGRSGTHTNPHDAGQEEPDSSTKVARESNLASARKPVASRRHAVSDARLRCPTQMSVSDARLRCSTQMSLAAASSSAFALAAAASSSARTRAAAASASALFLAASLASRS